MNVELDRILKLLGAKEIELDLLRDKIATLTKDLQKAEALIRDMKEAGKEVDHAG